jgi:GH18 family chitinase
MRLVKEQGIEVLLKIGSSEESLYFFTASADKQKRTDFINYLINTVEYFDADGIFFQWPIPGCKNVNFEMSSPK